MAMLKMKCFIIKQVGGEKRFKLLDWAVWKQKQGSAREQNVHQGLISSPERQAWAEGDADPRAMGSEDSDHPKISSRTQTAFLSC